MPTKAIRMRQITFPVRVMKSLGADLLVVSNACGGMNPQYGLGDIMVIEDHINLMGDNPLIGVNDDSLGPRFPDMNRPYDPVPDATRPWKSPGGRTSWPIKGVYVAVTGPNLETRAEYRFLRAIGADVVGMSTVPEVIVAVHAGHEGAGIVDHYRHVPARRPEAGQHRAHPGHRRRSEPKLRKIVLGILKQELES